MSQPCAQVLARGLDAHTRDGVSFGNPSKMLGRDQPSGAAVHLLIDLDRGIDHGSLLLAIWGKRRRHGVGRELVNCFDLLRSRLPDRIAGRERSRNGDALKIGEWSRIPFSAELE